MRKIVLLFIAALLFVTNAFAAADVIGNIGGGVVDFLLSNAEYLLPIVAWILYRFIPTAKADLILKFIKWVIELIPDKKKGGGKH